MRTIEVTKQEIQTLFSAASNFGDLLKLLEREFQKKGEVICKVKLNGIELTDEEETQKVGTTISNVCALEVVVAHPSDLLVDLLSFWAGRLPQLEEQTRKTADKIRFDGLDVSFQQFVNVVENCQELVRSLVPAKAILLANGILQEGQWTRAENSLWSTLSEIFRAFETKDFVLLSDLMEYDLGNALAGWTALVAQASLQSSALKSGVENATGESKEKESSIAD
ncbi:MAG: hypothetical protein AB7O96_06630 [Pseudobdellovibrionaceae bacterium]